MHTLTGYEIHQQLQQTGPWPVYVGARRTDAVQVQIKHVYASKKNGALEDVRREYELLQDLRGTQILHAVALEPCGDGLALVTEHRPQFESLTDCFRRRGAFGLDACLSIGIRLAVALAQVHERGVVHNDISLNSVRVREDDLQVVLSGFAHACRGPYRVVDARGVTARGFPRYTEDALATSGLKAIQETRTEQSLWREATRERFHGLVNLQTCSPERMSGCHRHVDGRSDLYAIGCLLYHLLAGEFPFPNLSRRELMHAHLVRAPVPLSQVRPGLLPRLVDIVHTLLAKDPGRRIASARLLAKALRDCRAQRFGRGRTDVPSGPKQAAVTSQGLVGRDVEVTRLVGALHRGRYGSTEFVLVGGRGGTGKSRLIHEVCRTVASGFAEVVAHTCDEATSAHPYAAIVSLLREVVDYTLKLNADDAQALVEDCVALAVLLGPLAPVQWRSSRDGGHALPSGTVFRRVTQKVIDILDRCSRKCFYIFVIDDLHLADTTSLAILGEIRKRFLRLPLAVVASFRSDRAAKVDALCSLFASQPVLWLFFAPIPASVWRRASDSLVSSNETHITPLAMALQRSDAPSAATAASGLEILSQRCARLSAQMRLRLRLMAECQYDPSLTLERRVLSTMTRASPEQLDTALQLAIDIGLVTRLAPLGRGRYVYWQPSVRRWLSLGLVKSYRNELHTRLAFEHLSARDLSAKAMFAAASHLLRAGKRIGDITRCLKASQALFRVSVIAMEAGAIDEGLAFLRRSMQLQPPELWERDRPFAKKLYAHVIDMETRYGDVRRAKACSERLLLYATLPQHRLLALRLRVQVESRAGRARAAFEVAASACREFGVAIPRRRSRKQTLRRAIRIHRLVDASIAMQPKRPAPRQHELVLLVRETTLAAFAVNPWRGLEVGLVLLGLVRRHGATPQTAAFACAIQSVASVVLDGPKEEFIAIANELYAHARTGTGAIHLTTRWMLLRWVLSWRWSDEEIERESIQLGREIVEQEVPGLQSLVAEHLAVRLISGDKPITEIERQIQGVLIRRGSDDFTLGVQWLCLRLSRGPDERAVSHPVQIERDSISLEVEVARFACLANALVHYLGGDIEASMMYIQPLGKLSQRVLPSRFDVEVMYVAGLVVAAALRRTGVHLTGWVRFWRAYRRVLAYSRWAPRVAFHRLQLLDAAIDHTRGRLEQAWAKYMAATDRGLVSGQMLLAGIGYRCAVEVVEAQGLRSLRPALLRSASEVFSRSGVRLAVGHAEAELTLLGHHVMSEGTGESVTLEGGPASELRTVIELSREISRELRLENLLEKLVHVLLTAVGGQRCVVMLALAGEMRVEAEATDSGESIIGLSVKLEKFKSLPLTVVDNVIESRKVVVSEDACLDFGDRDPYLKSKRVRSLMCVPVVHQGTVRGILYLEDRRAPGIFTQERVQLLSQLVAQIASSIENARLFHDLDRVRGAALLAERAKTRFLLNLSHELRTPLNAVIGYSELIEEELEDGDLELVGEDLGNICAATQRLQSTLSSIYLLSQLESGRAEVSLSRVDAAEVLDEIVKIYAPQATRRGLDFRWRAGEELVLTTDREKFEYCLKSLVDNACRFTERGYVSVVATTISEGGSDWIRIEVKDTGLGIDPEQQIGLFDPFRQVDDSTTRTFEGAGVSLAVTKQLCERLKGRLLLQSSLGEGSTFTIELPLE